MVDRLATTSRKLTLACLWSHSYTLLIGKPPFQTKDVKNIYRLRRSPLHVHSSR